MKTLCSFRSASRILGEMGDIFSLDKACASLGGSTTTGSGGSTASAAIGNRKVAEGSGGLAFALCGLDFAERGERNGPGFAATPTIRPCCPHADRGRGNAIPMPTGGGTTGCTGFLGGVRTGFGRIRGAGGAHARAAATGGGRGLAGAIVCFGGDSDWAFASGNLRLDSSSLFLKAKSSSWRMATSSNCAHERR